MAKDLCGLFNEQLYYMSKFYLPRSFRKEWKNTIDKYIVNDGNVDIFISEEIIFDFDRLKKYYFKKNKKNNKL